MKWISERESLYIDKKDIKYGDDIPDSVDKATLAYLKKQGLVGDIIVAVKEDEKPVKESKKYSKKGSKEEDSKKEGVS